jgi:hypothetical protein
VFQAEAVTGHFEFDQQRTQRTNQANDRPCPTCDGHRLVEVDQSGGDLGYESYMRCPACNPAPVTERPAVDARWKTYGS